MGHAADASRRAASRRPASSVNRRTAENGIRMPSEFRGDVVRIASGMICKEPRLVAGRAALSAYDGVWEAVESVPELIRPFLTDDLGRDGVVYGGFLQFMDVRAIRLACDLGLYCCFRMVEDELISALEVSPPVDFYESIERSLSFVGFDICNGNGWRSASTNGIFPRHSAESGVDQIDGIFPNQFGLIEDAEDCERLIMMNNELASIWAPWHKVSVLVDDCSKRKIDKILNGLG